MNRGRLVRLCGGILSSSLSACDSEEGYGERKFHVPSFFSQSSLDVQPSSEYNFTLKGQRCGDLGRAGGTVRAAGPD